jgi:TPR repeat protein
MYELGDGVERDLIKAEDYYLAAARTGAPIANVLLGHMYLRQRRHQDAFRVTNEAAARGHAPAIHWLGRMYVSAIGVPRDLEHAERLFKLAAAKGHIRAKLAYAALLMRDRAHPWRFARGTALKIVAFFQFTAIYATRGLRDQRLL